MGTFRSRAFATVAALSVVFSGAVGFTQVAEAVIGTTSGDIVQITPPPSVDINQLNSLSTVYAFNEQQGVTLASPMTVDIATPGVYDEASDVHRSTVPSGTVVDSQFIDSPKLVDATTYLRTGTITFPTDIVGVMTSSTTLDDSDVLGAPGTVYPTGRVDRRLEIGQGALPDAVTLPDLRTLEVSLNAGTSGLDHIRVLTRHNAAPTASAGGPYAGTEGTPVSLAATATDSDNDPITTSWAITHTADPGTTCSMAGGTTLTPSITCTDDAMVTAVLTVSDGVNPSVTSSATVTIGNQLPVLGALGVPAAPVALGSTANVSVEVGDAGTNDTHTATVAWGDVSASAATVSESAGAGTVAASHTYAAAGIYTVMVTVTDDDGASATTTGQVSVNGPPQADAGGPYAGAEGFPTAVVGTAVDPENDPLGIGWTFTPDSLDAGGSCSSVGDASLTPSVTCNDDAVVHAELSAGDGVNPPTISSSTIAVANEAPLLGALGVTAGPIASGAPVSVAAPFTDDGTNDTHTATVDWGDLSTSPATVTESGGSGSLAATHAYSAPGIYSIHVAVIDDDLGADQQSATVVVNSAPDADAGGPYVGLEGAPLSLAGTASDADGDVLAIAWTFSVSAEPGTLCVPVGGATLTPTITCNDDATIVATLTVSDGVNPPVSDTTTLEVGNAAPVVGEAVPSAGTAPPNTPVSLGLTFSDDGANDTHTATIDWGDGTVESGTIGGTAASGTVSGSHVYTTSGTFAIVVTVTDDDAGVAVSDPSTVVINGAPTAGVGGPYSGVEGAPVTLTGSATDPDADALLVGWTHAILVADPMTTCSMTDASTLTPSLACDDDASVSVTLTIADGVNPVVVDSTTVTIANADPATATPTVMPNPVPLGAPVSLAASFTDPGVNDNHSATIAWGDATTTTGTVAEVPGSGTVTGGHTFGAPGTYTVKATVNDKDGGKNSATVPVVVNAPPVIDAAGPYSGQEGSPLSLAGSATDADGDPLALSWSFAVTTDPGGTCTMSGTATLVPSVTCTDDSSVLATLTASDGVNPPVTDTATITIANQTPGIGLVTVTSAPVPIGTQVTALTTFVDPGSNDGHTASVAWGDGATSAGTVAETGGNGSVTGSHPYAAAGTYTVTITVADDDGGTATRTATTQVVVFDGSTGFVTGGGWLDSPSGAYTPNDATDPNLTGRGEFGFVARKRASDPTPTGETEFQLRLRRTGPAHSDDRRGGCRDDRRDDGWDESPSFGFHSTSYVSLTVTGSATAVFRGTGKLNGATGYEFLVSVVDGKASHSFDRFRIKIWNASSGAVLYDNQAGAADDATATGAISGGSIVIHT